MSNPDPNKTLEITQETLNKLTLWKQTKWPAWQPPEVGQCQPFVKGECRHSHFIYNMSITNWSEDGKIYLCSDMAKDRWAEIFDFDLETLTFRKNWLTIRTECQMGRIEWHAQENRAKPWAIFWQGTATNRCATVAEAREYFKQKGAKLLPDPHQSGI